MKGILPIACNWFCFCVRFTISEREWTKLLKEIKSKEYRTSATEEVKKTSIPVTLNMFWGKMKKEPKMYFAFRMAARGSLNYEKFPKALSPTQKRLDGLLEKYSIKEAEAMVCGEFDFSLKAYSPVGQISLPAELPLDLGLVSKIGKPTLTGFVISFENSPLGLEKASLELEKGKDDFSITVASGFRSASKETIMLSAFGHIAEVTRLFVEKKDKEHKERMACQKS